MSDQEPQDDELRAAEIQFVEHLGEELFEKNPPFLLLFERGRNMPHFSAVRSSWEKACADCKLAAFDWNRYFRAAVTSRKSNKQDLPI